jgi:hypothetical protein
MMSKSESTAQKHADHDSLGYLVEDGWRCDGCKKVIGESSFLDRECIDVKVEELAVYFNDVDEISASNATEGYMAIEYVTELCREKQLYSTEFIKKQLRKYLKKRLSD